MLYTLSLSRIKNEAAGFVQWLILFGVSGGTLLALASGLLVPDWFGEGRYLTHPISYGDQMPAMDETLPELPEDIVSTSEGQSVLRLWSEVNLPSWERHGKGSAPRILLAKLAENNDVEAANRYICSLTPWSGAGSTWAFHRGDYDFTLVTLTTLLYMFGHQPDRMYPETQQYLLDVLLNQEGGVPLVTAPRTFGLILDTENHHLMTEGSRYLKNQWLATNGTEEQRANSRYDNQENDLEEWLIGNLDEMLHEGVYEFNSRPYIAYTIQALLNLEAYPESQQIRMRARHLLDIINLQYALGSLDLRRYPPFRRQYRKAKETRMDNDAHTAYMRIWTGGTSSEPGERSDFALLAELLPYRLPADLRKWTLSKPSPYFARYGRGASACPELYSGGPGYLLSAGGANRGRRSSIVARPITLMLSDGETDAEHCFQLPGQGHWRRWNSTGVYRRFAVSNAPVSIPEKQKPVAEAAGWQVFSGPEQSSLLIAVYSEAHLGIMALFPETTETPEALLASLQQQNPDTEALRGRFAWPDGTVLEYDPDAPKGMWVMKSENGVALDRNYDTWPQLDGDVPVLSFE